MEPSPHAHPLPAAGDRAAAAGAGISLPALIRMHHAAEGVPLHAVNVRAAQSGACLSPFRGRGMEFEESRRYQPGDDVRMLDWRVTARTGEPHTKLFREERERPVLLWVDLRPAMFFATQGAYKSVQASRAAALLGWSAVRHGDRVGGLIFSGDEHVEVRPQRGRRAALGFLRALARHSAWTGPGDAAQADAGDALLRLRRVARPGSLVFLLSDMRSISEHGEAHLAHIARHNDIVLVFIADRLERELPPADRYRVADGRRELILDTANVRDRRRHNDRFRRRFEDLTALCRRNRIYLIECSTADDVVATLQRGLRLRAS